jgi:type I restriction enzyme, S subunit
LLVEILLVIQQPLYYGIISCSPLIVDQGIPFYKVSDMNIVGNEREMVSQNNTVSEDIRKLLGASIIAKGSTIFPKIGGAIATNKKRLIVQNCCVDNNVMGVIPNKEKIDSDFRYYFFLSHDLSDFANEAHLPSIKKTVVENCEIIIPLEIFEQQRIVAILDKAFEGIAKAKANAEKNLKNARALFDSYMNSVFSQRGDGWEKKTLDEISLNLDSKRIPITKSDRKSGEYPYYGASGIVDYVADYIFEGDTLLVSEDGANLLARSTPIAFSVSGQYWVNNHAHILKFENIATQRFVEFYLESIKLDEYITGAAQPKLNQKALNSIQIPIPNSVGVQAKVVESLMILSSETRRLESIYQKKITALDALKKSILHKAFSGEL